MGNLSGVVMACVNGGVDVGVCDGLSMTCAGVCWGVCYMHVFVCVYVCVSRHSVRSVARLVHGHVLGFGFFCARHTGPLFNSLRLWLPLEPQDAVAQAQVPAAAATAHLTQDTSSSHLACRPLAYLHPHIETH